MQLVIGAYSRLVRRPVLSYIFGQNKTEIGRFFFRTKTAAKFDVDKVCWEAACRLWAGWVYRPQPKRKRTDMSMNPLWARYMQQQGGSPSPFSPVLCRPPTMSASNPSSVVSPPISSLSNAIDRAKLTGMFLTIVVVNVYERFFYFTIKNAFFNFFIFPMFFLFLKNVTQLV